MRKMIISDKISGNIENAHISSSGNPKIEKRANFQQIFKFQKHVNSYPFCTKMPNFGVLGSKMRILGSKNDFWEFNKGGRTEFRFSHFLTLTLRCTFIFHPKYPSKGLKWPWEHFLSISKNQIFLPFSIWGESPTPRNFFFKICFFKI